MRASLTTTTAKIFASVVLVGGAAGVAGLGTYGSFTDTTNASESVSDGKVHMDLSQHGNLGTTVAATNLVPGDTIQRAVTLTRGSDSEKFGTVSVTTTAGLANVLASDATNGLQVSLDQCSVPWTQVGTTSQLVCTGGTATPVMASRPVIGSNLELGAATTTLNSAAAASNLRLTMVLPTTAGDGFQGIGNAITFKFDATQRTADFR